MPNVDQESRRQVRTRSFNEWVEDANDSMGAHTGTDPFRCECGDGKCTHTIDLTRVEYEAVRASARRFALARDHENPSDTVVAEHERYTIVEKLVGRASRHAYRTNPR